MWYLNAYKITLGTCVFLKMEARSAGLLPAFVLIVLSAPSWRSFSTDSCLPYCTAIDKAWQKILIPIITQKVKCIKRLSQWNISNKFYIVLMTSELQHYLQIPNEGTCYKHKIVTHSVSIAILDVDFCAVGHQQVDDFTVAVPGCQHQAGHLRPEKRQ